MTKRASWAAVLVVVLAIGGAEASVAHRQPVDLAFWGGFTPAAARCQRALSRAATRCIDRVVAARAACFAPILDGGTCNQSALTAAVDAARLEARRQIEKGCGDTDVLVLGYRDLDDARTDIDAVCERVATAAITSAFGPALVSGSVAAVDPAGAACVRAGLALDRRMLRVALRAHQKVLDRIAELELVPEAKSGLVAWAAQRIDGARASFARRLPETCPSPAFETAYGRSIEAHLTLVAEQAKCMAGVVYAQTAVVCPAPVCGNGMQELPGEQCDDGDARDDDGCRADCTTCAIAASSYDLIQHAIFERRDCTAGACHGVIQSGGLDLQAGVSYDQTVGVISSVDPERVRIAPGDPDSSVLFLKLAAKTLPEQYPAGELGVGSPMPLGPVPGVPEDELEALRLWILASAPRSAIVAGVSERLNGCPLPPGAIR